MKKKLADIATLLSKSARNFSENDPIMLSAALAFFTVFAIPPILIMIIFSVGLFVGQQGASAEVFSQIEQLIGSISSEVLQDIVSHYFVEEQSMAQRLLGIGIFLFASSSFFIIIQHAINQIWNVKPKTKTGVVKIIKNRALSFGIIILMGLILVLSLGTQLIFSAIRKDLYKLSPLLSPVFLTTLGVLVSYLLGILSFGVIFKFLPDVIIKWEVVWVGAAITSLLFLLGKYIIGFALSSSNIQAMYGAAGSMAIFLLWVFYSSLILFFGAKITQQYAFSFAETIQPKEHAVKVKTVEVGANSDR